MRIIQALPGRMRFEAIAASSVELCLAEWVAGSRYKQEITVFAEPGGAPLADVDIFRVVPPKRFRSWHLAYTIRQQVRLRGYDLICIQQHIPTAGRIAAINRKTPVILQTHNFVEPPKRGVGARLHNIMRLRQLKRLAGITLISQATLRQFESDWPDVAIPRRVISNGFNFSSWRPATKRQKTVIVVGRAHEAKGILETAKGVSVFLEKFRDWRAVFVLSAPKQSKEYFDSVVDALRPFKSQIDVMTDIPFAQVKQITENAAISVVASKWEEPFGRTALEAHAGGAALISSQTGGLREISGDAASYLDEVTSSTIASALLRLASDDALREKMSHEGMQRVRRLFSLARNSNEVAGEVIPICERLDQFYREVLENHNRSARESKCDYRGAI